MKQARTQIPWCGVGNQTRDYCIHETCLNYLQKRRVKNLGVNQGLNLQLLQHSLITREEISPGDEGGKSMGGWESDGNSGYEKFKTDNWST